jgi:hypothetical protein
MQRRVCIKEIEKSRRGLPHTRVQQAVLTESRAREVK